MKRSITLIFFITSPPPSPPYKHKFFETTESKKELKKPRPRVSTVLARTPRHCLLQPDWGSRGGLRMKEHAWPLTTDVEKYFVFLSFFLAWSCILNPPLDPQSGCRRQCLGVGAKTVVTLGLGLGRGLGLGLFNSFLNSVVSRNLHFLGGRRRGSYEKY